MIFNMTGGGAPLNFKVVPNPQPDTAKENTIWVDTDRINNYYFSATQPEGMVDYDVWFLAGYSSTVEFNALKKNGIQVYPLSAKQYIGGALVDKTAKSWQNGAWVEWYNGLVIYNAGSFTHGYDIDKKTDYGTIAVTKNTYSMTWEGSGNAWNIFYVTPSFSPRYYNTLYMTVENARGTIDSDSGKFGLASSVSSPEYASFVSGCQSFSKFRGSKTFKVDISSISGTTNYYVALRFGTTDETFSFDVTKIWLE